MQILQTVTKCATLSALILPGLEWSETTALFVPSSQFPVASVFLLQYFLGAIPTAQVCVREFFPAQKPKRDTSSTSVWLFCHRACCFCFCCELFEYFTRFLGGTVRRNTFECASETAFRNLGYCASDLITNVILINFCHKE